MIQVGIRVIVLRNAGPDGRNERGVVIAKHPDRPNIWCIEFDNDIMGHSANGRGKDGYCWWVDKLDINPLTCKIR